MTRDRIVRADVVGTAVFAVSSTLGVAGPDAARLGAAGVSGVLFVVGCGAFAVGFLAAVGRSRSEEVALAGLFFLSRTAPAAIRRQMIGLLGAQTLIALTAASLRPFTANAFGILAPMYGLGLMTLWGGRHGDFVAKTPDPTAAD